jgi:hypothetical protein
MSEASPEPGAETPHPPVEPRPVEPRPRRPRRLVARLGLGLSAAIILILAVIGTEPYWQPALAPLLSWGPTATPAPASVPEKSDAQAALTARLDALERRLQALPSLDNRLTALEQRPVPDTQASLAPLQSQLQQLSTRLDQLNQRIDQLVKDESQRGDSAQRVLLVALASLGNAISSSQPFSAELASVEALGRGRPDWAQSLRPLEDKAKTGLPSTAILAGRFSDEVAPAILRAEAAGPSAQQSIGQAVLAKLRGLVVIRRTDGAGGGTPAQQAVAAADSALQKGDLAGAVAALKPLTGPAAEAAAPWLAEAQQRLAAEQIVARLSQQVSADLAAGAGGG